ncbi:hypothetical protein DL98DRAFT_588478 [Cadophora sp. DSE1049]|nr:hypothetical protein DL98DRAFT_588478 [Cadophora sp. DSE1049]
MALLACFRASGDTTPATNAVYNGDKRSISLSGHIVDEINKVAPRLPTKESQGRSVGQTHSSQVIFEWLDGPKALYESDALHPTGLPYYPDVLWRTLVAGMDCFGSPAPASFQCCFENFIIIMEHMRHPEEGWTSPGGPEVLDPIHNFLLAMSSCAPCRRVFATRFGYLGLGPVGIEAGDRICIFLGFSTPFVVRPRDGGGYLVVGECYIYGLMDGEALVEGTLEDIILY